MTKELQILNLIKEDLHDIKSDISKIYEKIDITSARTIINSEKVKNIESDRPKIIKEATQKVMLWLYGLLAAAVGSIIFLFLKTLFGGK